MRQAEAIFSRADTLTMRASAHRAIDWLQDSSAAAQAAALRLLCASPQSAASDLRSSSSASAAKAGKDNLFLFLQTPRGMSKRGLNLSRR